MLRRSLRTLLATAGIVAVVGTGVAVAADPPTCPYGNTPQVTRTQDRDTVRQQLRKRDGTGPRHAQRVQQRQGSQHRGLGHQGTGNPACPYRG